MLFRLGWPMVFTFIGNAAYGTIIVFATSQISPEAVASIGLVGNFVAFTVMFFFVSLSAITPITAELKGAKRNHLVGALLKNGFKLAIVFSLVIGVLVSCLWPFLALLPLPSKGITLAKGYLGIVLWSIPLDLVCCVIMFASSGLGRTFWVGVINFLAAPILLLLVWILAFGNLGAPPLGVEGCGYAVFITITLKSVASIFLALQEEFRSIEFIKSRTVADVNNAKRVLSVGLPLGLSEASIIAFGTANAFFIAGFGVTALAAHNLALNVLMICHSLMFGLSRATVIRIGTLKGQQAPISALRSCVFASLFLAICSAFLSLFPIIFFSSDIAQIYTDEAAVVSILSTLIAGVGVFKLIDDPLIALQAFLEGTQKTHTILLIRASGIVFGLLVGYTMSLWFGLYGFWLGIGAFAMFALSGYAINVRAALGSKQPAIAD